MSIIKIGPVHDKTNKMTCAPSDNSDQPGYRPSLIRVFNCAHSVAKDSSFLHADSEDSDQTGRIPSLMIRIKTLKDTLFKTW